MQQRGWTDEDPRLTSVAVRRTPLFGIPATSQALYSFSFKSILEAIGGIGVTMNLRVGLSSQDFEESREEGLRQCQRGSVGFGRFSQRNVEKDLK